MTTRASGLHNEMAGCCGRRRVGDLELHPTVVSDRLEGWKPPVAGHVLVTSRQRDFYHGHLVFSAQCVPLRPVVVGIRPKFRGTGPPRGRRSAAQACRKFVWE